MQLKKITGELLNQAVTVYLAHAYKGFQEKVQPVPRFEPQLTLPEILAREPRVFEDLSGGGTPLPAGLAAPPAPGSGARMYALRLGNAGYPHMKLALVEAYFEDEFVFAVDRHDTFHFEPDAPGYEAWCELKEINRLVKEAVEDAWHAAGLPTLQGLREERFTGTALARTLKRADFRILILDDDVSRAQILQQILEAGSYAVVVGPPGPKPAPSESTILRARQRARGASLRLPASACPGAADVGALCALAREHAVALTILDVSYCTGQGPRVARALRLEPVSQDIPILGIYSRRDFGPDPELFDAALRRPYRTEALLELVERTLVRRGHSGSGLHPSVRP